MRPVPTLSTTTPREYPRGVRVPLRLVHLDYWSFMKVFFLASVVLGIVTITSMLLLYLAFETSGAISYLDELTGSLTEGRLQVSEFVNFPKALWFSAITSTLSVIIITVSGAVVAGIYNFAVQIFDGLKVRFAAK